MWLTVSAAIYLITVRCKRSADYFFFLPTFTSFFKTFLHSINSFDMSLSFYSEGLELSSSSSSYNSSSFDRCSSESQTDISAPHSPSHSNKDDDDKEFLGDLGLQRGLVSKLTSRLDLHGMAITPNLDRLTQRSKSQDDIGYESDFEGIKQRSRKRIVKALRRLGFVRNSPFSSVADISDEVGNFCSIVFSILMIAFY